MTPIRTLAEYRRAMDQIKRLKHRMWVLATQLGNLDPEVIQISQEIDEYIVCVQRYWQRHDTEDILIG